MECFENWLDSVHKASWPPQVGIQCMILFLFSELLGQASPVQRGHYLCFWTAWRGNSHHSGQNNPLQFLNGGDCLSMEHKFNRTRVSSPVSRQGMTERVWRRVNGCQAVGGCEVYHGDRHQPFMQWFQPFVTFPWINHFIRICKNNNV